MSWPKRITARGEIRSQFHHVIDIAPTILEAVGVQAPLILGGVTQMPMEGVSMCYTFEDAMAPTRHATQYFEITANRGLYHTVAEGRIEKTVPFRFSLDESFDVGEDTGSPVIDEYDAKMPFQFTGTLRKVDIKLGTDQLSPEKQAELAGLKKDLQLRVQ
jgi:arylsulfatase A-like enzyme